MKSSPPWPASSRAAPGIKVDISGYADPTGNVEQNLELAQAAGDRPCATR